MTPTAHAQRPLVVFADDWGRHPSSCQHLVRRLLPHREVVWVNTIGTRPPRLDLGTLKRVAGKLRQWGSDTPATPTDSELSPRVVAPKMLPSFKGPWRAANRRLLTRGLRSTFAGLSRPPAVVTTLPLTADLVGALPAHRWLYYCVDDFGVWPGYDGATMRAMERDLVPRVDAAVAVSDALVSHLAALGRPAHLLTHGVDLGHWRREPGLVPPCLAGLTPPFAVFWGVIDRRLDSAFVRHLAANLAAGTLVLVGPREDPDPALMALSRVAVRPALPFAELPALAAAASVLVMPYADAPVTRAMQPLKLKEYLATGKPAVVRDLPATREWSDACDLAGTPEAFTAAVNARLTDGPPAEQVAARHRLDAEGWDAKAAQFEAWLDG
jgi:glycosyltransferase involved in cell wall biosynthesis